MAKIAHLQHGAQRIMPLVQRQLNRNDRPSVPSKTCGQESAETTIRQDLDSAAMAAVVFSSGRVKLAFAGGADARQPRRSQIEGDECEAKAHGRSEGDQAHNEGSTRTGKGERPFPKAAGSEQRRQQKADHVAAVHPKAADRKHRRDKLDADIRALSPIPTCQ
eukprot:scaffold4574_cov143-Isochrysis_galbana.AAC.3